MVTVIIQFNIYPTLSEQFKILTLENIKERRNASGNLKTEFYQKEEKPHHFILIEAFESQETIDGYYGSQAYENWHMATRDMIKRIKGNDYKVL